MIRFIHATTLSIDTQRIVAQIGQIAFDLLVPYSAAFIVGKEQKIYVHFHWNQEQGPTLYGFLNEFDKAIFLQIISCSGIGPKIGLSIISELGSQGLISAINGHDIKTLNRVNGLGPKKAEQLVVQLKHKIKDFLIDNTLNEKVGPDYKTVAQALESLHYTRQEIGQAVHYLQGKDTLAEATFDQLMRHALSFLSKRV